MSDRPRRSSALKLSSEEMREMFDSHSDCSDNDPDFSVERKKKSGRASWLSRPGASSSSEEADDSGQKGGRRKKARKTPKEPGVVKRPVGRPRKNSAQPPGTPRRPRGRQSKLCAASPAAVAPPAAAADSPAVALPAAAADSPAVALPAAAADSAAVALPAAAADSPAAAAAPLAATTPPAAATRTPASSNLPPATAAVTTAPTTPTAATSAAAAAVAATPTPATPPTTNGSSAAQACGQPSSSGTPAKVISPRATAAVSSPGYVTLENDVPIIMPTSRRGHPQGPPYYCCVRGCKSRDITDRDGLWLFALPEDPELRRIWDERLPINHERNRPQSPRVCFQHFEKEAYARQKQRVTGLRQGSLPKIETRRT